MASPSPDNSSAGVGGAPNPNQKTLQVWSEPLKPEDQQRLENKSSTASNGPATISAAVSTIKKEDFVNIAQMPCARGGLLTGIASGATVGGLRFVMRGKGDRQWNL